MLTHFSLFSGIGGIDAEIEETIVKESEVEESEVRN